MGRFFSMDNPIMRVLAKIIDAFYISVLWILFSIPIVTLGASTQALYYTVHKCLKGDRGYVWGSFWQSFKDHFLENLLITVIFEGLFAFVTYDRLLMDEWIAVGSEYTKIFGVMFYVFCFLQGFFIVWFIETVCYRARFEMDWKGSLKNSIKILLAFLPTSLLTGLLIVVSVLLFYIIPFGLIPFLIMFLPAVDALALDFMYERIYRRFMNEEDRQLEEEYDYDRKRDR